MFGRLKNLFRKRVEVPALGEADDPGFPPREFQPGYDPAAPPSQVASAPPPGSTEVETRQPAGDSIRILLKPVLLRLPDVLKARVRQPPAGPVPISIPLQKVLAQLSQGSVRISFGELRQASPAGVFLDMNDQDQTPVELPLPEIVAQIRPEQFPRRAAQKKIEVPEEVGGIFGPKGEPLSSLRTSAATPHAPPPAPAATAARAMPAPPFAPRPEAPVAPSIQPAVPIKPSSPLPPPPAKPAPSAPATAPLRMQPPSPPPAPAIKPLPMPRPAAPKPAQVVTPTAPVPMPAPVAAPAVAPQPPAPPMEPLVIALAQLIGGWPDAIQQALAQFPDATISFPADELEQALKRGKTVFPWKRIRTLIQPPLPAEAELPALDESPLELPLPIIAPLFLAHKKPAAPQRKYAITEHIPDVFAGKGMAPSTQAQVAAPVDTAPPVAAPAAPRPAPVAPVAPARPVAAPIPMAPVPAAPAAPQEIGEVFGQPGRKNFTPSEIVQKTSALKGVGGALIAMQDGLLVAGHLPPGLNGETIAAFLPQMFSRVLQYTKELKFSEANDLTIIVDDVPLKIFKAGGVYFTVLGRAEEALPEPHLSIIAAQLGPQNK